MKYCIAVLSLFWFCLCLADPPSPNHDDTPGFVAPDFDHDKPSGSKQIQREAEAVFYGLAQSKAMSEKDIINHTPANRKPRCFWSRYLGSFIQSYKHLDRVGIDRYNAFIDFFDRIEMGKADTEAPTTSTFNASARQKAVGEFLSTDFGNKNYRGTGFDSVLKARKFAYGRISCMLRIICNIQGCPMKFKKEVVRHLETARHMLLDASVADRLMALLESYGQKLCLGAGLIVSVIAAYYSIKWIIREKNSPTQQLLEEISNLRKDLKGNVDRLESHAKTEMSDFLSKFREFLQQQLAADSKRLIDELIDRGIIGICKGRNPTPTPPGEAFDDRLIELFRQELGRESLLKILAEVGGLEGLWYGKQGKAPDPAAAPPAQGPKSEEFKAWAKSCAQDPKGSLQSGAIRTGDAVWACTGGLLAKGFGRLARESGLHAVKPAARQAPPHILTPGGGPRKP